MWANHQCQTQSSLNFDKSRQFFFKISGYKITDIVIVVCAISEEKLGENKFH